MALIERKLLNIILLGCSFLLVFTAFNTGGNIQKKVVDSLQDITHGTYTADGFTSLCIVYASFGMANWFAPSLIAVIGAKFSMIAGALTYM